MVVQLKDHLVALLEEQKHRICEQNHQISSLQQHLDNSQRVLETHNEMMKALVTRITILETHLPEMMKVDLIDTQSDSGASNKSFKMVDVQE